MKRMILKLALLVFLVGTFFIGLLMLRENKSSPFAASAEEMTIISSLEPKNVEWGNSEFLYWDGGQHLYLYLKKEPVAFFHTGGFFAAYNGAVSGINDAPMIYVYDLWRGNRHDDKCKEVFGYSVDVRGWEDIENLSLEEGRAKLILPLDRSDSDIIEQLHEQVGGNSLRADTDSGVY